MDVSAAAIRRALIGAHYPCTKGELIGRASANDAGEEVKRALNVLPNEGYNDADEVLAALEASSR